jgi:hypothetical protein
LFEDFKLGTDDDADYETSEGASEGSKVGKDNGTADEISE